MKFEEVLPAMRDEGRIGKHGAYQYRIRKDCLIEFLNKSGIWESLRDVDVNFFLSTYWSLEPRAEKREE